MKSTYPFQTEYSYMTTDNSIEYECCYTKEFLSPQSAIDSLTNKIKALTVIIPHLINEAYSDDVTFGICEIFNDLETHCLAVKEAIKRKQ